MRWSLRTIFAPFNVSLTSLISVGFCAWSSLQMSARTELHRKDIQKSPKDRVVHLPTFQKQLLVRVTR